MSNRVMFTAINFIPTHGKYKGQNNFGFIASDDYDSVIKEGYESPMPSNDKEFFFIILSQSNQYFHDERLDALLNEAYEKGAFLNDIYYICDILRLWHNEFINLPENN